MHLVAKKSLPSLGGPFRPPRPPTRTRYDFASLSVTGFRQKNLAREVSNLVILSLHSFIDRRYGLQTSALTTQPLVVVVTSR